MNYFQEFLSSDASLLTLYPPRSLLIKCIFLNAETMVILYSLWVFNFSFFFQNCTAEILSTRITFWTILTIFVSLHFKNNHDIIYHWLLKANIFWLTKVPSGHAILWRLFVGFINGIIGLFAI